MPFAKGKSGNPAGKPKGKINKYSYLKEDMLFVYKKMGGKKALFDWAKASLQTKEVFYKELIKLLPRDLTIDADMNVRFEWEGGNDTLNKGPL